jgi:hypothetical protein
LARSADLGRPACSQGFGWAPLVLPVATLVVMARRRRGAAARLKML